MSHADDAIVVHLEYIKAGIDELRAGQKEQNGQLRAHGQAIAVLEDRATEAKTAGRNYGAGFGAAGGFLGGFVAAFVQWLVGGKSS